MRDSGEERRKGQVAVNKMVRSDNTFILDQTKPREERASANLRLAGDGTGTILVSRWPDAKHRLSDHLTKYLSPSSVEHSELHLMNSNMNTFDCSLLLRCRS